MLGAPAEQQLAAWRTLPALPPETPLSSPSLPLAKQVAMAISMALSFPITIWPMREDIIGAWGAVARAALEMYRGAVWPPALGAFL